jgi:glycerol-3-phosphate dehydrogenase (NAD(P)+)
MSGRVPACAVVGAGMWGTTVAILLAARGPVTLVAHDPEHAAEVGRRREVRSLPGIAIPASVTVTADAGAVREASGLVVMAVPARSMREAAERVAAHLSPDAVIVSVAKGIEPGTLRRMSEVIVATAPSVEGRVAVLSGPNLAPEIARGLPAAAVVSAPRDPIGQAVVERLASPTLRLYRNRDLVGVELAGALKNVVAIVAGAVDALGLGDNAKAAITTRGLTEITRLGVAMGANPLTFAGLAGIGDIIATCSSPISRNHRLGAEVAMGRPWREVEASLPGVAEGAYTVVAALELAGRHGVDMPLAREVHAVLYEGKDVRRSLADLVARGSRDELAGLSRPEMFDPG